MGGTLPEILSEIRNSPAPLRLDELRSRLRVRKQRLVEALRELTESDLVKRSGDGFAQKQLSFE
jgi:DNA-binding HxlR family transcriptional regulator